jgi:putative tryptophan/tyrosine transport system substrate-binding protein
VTPFWIFGFRFWITAAKRGEFMNEKTWLRILIPFSGNLKSAIFNLKRAGLFAISLAFPLGADVAGAQHPGKVYRIGYLTAGFVEESFRQRLRELGYTEGKNLLIEYRFAKRSDQYPDLANDVVRLRVDLILAVGVSATRAAKNASGAIPIVMGNASDDPVRQGLVASLAQPGGNVTGVIDMLPDLAGKRLELLKDAFPRLSRVAHLVQRGSPDGPVQTHLRETEAAARSLGVQVQALQVPSADDLENAFQAATKGGAEALVVVGTGILIPQRQRIVNLELKNRLPTMHTHPKWVSDGGFMSYTTDEAARYRRAAEYVDRILKGVKPADLPVERPTKFIFEINLKTAKQIGLTIPQKVLAKADRVIK